MRETTCSRDPPAGRLEAYDGAGTPVADRPASDGDLGVSGTMVADVGGESREERLSRLEHANIALHGRCLRRLL